MRSILSRVLCVLLIIAMLPACLMQGAVPVSAAYENTYVNTGDQRADLIGVALTQVGYTEGSNNYTKYGVWYGSSNMAWCGAFISWCANHADIPTTVLRKHGYASLSGFGITDTFKYDGSRTPQPGDLFVRNSAHIGIVYYVDGEYFYTVEGNTSTTSSNGNQVCIRKRKLNDSRFTFGSPNYTSDAGHNYEKGYETAHPHKEYYKCTDCGSTYYTGNTGTLDSCQLCIQENCSHSYGAWTRVSDSKHEHTCSKCAKTETASHNWGSDTVLKAATCGAAGTKKQTCTGCGATREVSIPATGRHDYGEWSFKDETSHSHKCQTCGKVESKTHTIDEEVWETDLYEHWHICADCEGLVQVEEHTLGESCDAPCQVCGYVSETGHLYKSTWSFDETDHWHKCENCDATDVASSHVFSAECDESCDECGYIRVTEHTFAEEWTVGDEGHYHACTICGAADEIVPHTGGDAATEEHGQTCTVCGYEMEAVLAHVHTYEPYSYDQTGHWGQCRCGQLLEHEGHVWDVTTGKCRICGMESIAPQKQIPHWVYLLPVVAGGALIAVILLLIFLIRRKRRAKKKELAAV